MHTLLHILGWLMLAQIAIIVLGLIFLSVIGRMAFHPERWRSRGTVQRRC